jgi:hypothetical protein
MENVVIPTTSVEAMGLEPTNLLTASQALYQLSYAPGQLGRLPVSSLSAVTNGGAGPAGRTAVRLFDRPR